jgi:hypothetical protein
MNPMISFVKMNIGLLEIVFLIEYDHSLCDNEAKLLE